MTALEEHPQYASAPLVITMVLVAIFGLPLGLFGSIFGPYYAMVLGAALAIVGMVGSLRGGRWIRVLMVFGMAVIAGALIYILLGMLVPAGTGSGSGSGCAVGESCE